MLPNINFIIWFRVARPIKHKYNLTTNCTLILNACYVHSVIIGKPFTRNQIRRFANYFNNRRIDSYVDILIKGNYITVVNKSKTGKVVYYSITPLGLQVIKELNDNYNSVLYSFCDQYSIIL